MSEPGIFCDNCEDDDCDGGAEPEVPQTWRIEIRFDVTGTKAEAEEAANKATAAIDHKIGTNAEVTDIADENWESIGG